MRTRAGESEDGCTCAVIQLYQCYFVWLNQAELWFAKIERDVIARGIFTSVSDLAANCVATSTPIQPMLDPFNGSTQIQLDAFTLTISLRQATSGHATFARVFSARCAAVLNISQSHQTVATCRLRQLSPGATTAVTVVCTGNRWELLIRLRMSYWLPPDEVDPVIVASFSKDITYFLPAKSTSVRDRLPSSFFRDSTAS